jgi:hypothetical protein
MVNIMVKKDQTFILISLLLLTILTGALILAVSGDRKDVKPPEETIKQKLAGMNITYYSIAGKPMYFVVSVDDIKSIDKTEFNGKSAWKARVGEGLAWDITLDAKGNVLDTKQLFYT